MKIVIALASCPSQLSGVQRHAINLARCLLTRCEVTEVHLVASPWQLSFVAGSTMRGDNRLHLHAALIGNSVLSRNLWFYTQLPKLAIQLDADIVHLGYPAPMPRDGFDCPAVVTLHDLYPYDIPENFGFPKVFVNRAILQQCLRRVDSIVCVSKSTFLRLKELSPKLARKAGVIYNALEPPASPPNEIAPHWGTQPFMLCVAQHRRNKNILLALRVFDRLLRAQQIPAWTRLLIVGIPGPETSSIKAFIAASGLTQRVVLLSGISDAQLQWCYGNCSLMLAPSVIEGFGLPVAEALLAGCRVVCSDIPAFRELGSSHCHFVTLGPNQVEAFADAITKALDLETPEPIALPQLSPPVIAEEYMRLYQSLLPEAVAVAGSNLTPFATA